MPVSAMPSASPSSHAITSHPVPAPRAAPVVTRSARPSAWRTAAAAPTVAPSGLELPCRTDDGDLWFADDPADLELAKQRCGDCPVRAACLAGAAERREPWGVWGGELFARGVVVPRKRPRGRPRKDAAAA